MNGLAVSNDSLRAANRARKQVLLAELDKLQAQKAAVEQQIAALSRGPVKASGGVKKRPSKGVPLEDLRPDKRPKIQSDWPKKESVIWSNCLAACKSLTKGAVSHVFMQPVNTDQLPDYKNFVSKPMDLGTILKKLNSKPRAYKTPMQFRDDVRQVWENCRRYNLPDSQVGKAGLTLSEKFEKEWSKLMLEEKWEQIQTGKQQDAMDGAANPESFNRLGKRLRDITEHIEFQSNPGIPRSDRDMSFEEKRKLSVFIGEMDGDKLEQVLEIVSQDQQEGLPGAQDGEIELDIDQLSRKTLWALHDLCTSTVPAKNGGPPRKGGGGRSGTPGGARGGSAGPANHAEVSSQRSPAVKKEGSGATQGGAASQRPAVAESSTSSDSSSDDEDMQAQPRKQGGAGPTLMSTNHTQGPSILPSGGGKARQDTTLASKAAWDNLARSPAAQSDDGQQGAEEEEGNGDVLWTNFKSQDDAEREKKQQEVKQKEEAIRKQKEQEAKQKAEAAEKAREEEEKQKAAEASKRDAAEAERLRTIEEAKAKDRAVLEAQVEGSDLEGAKNVHKLLHKAAAPVDGGLALQNDGNDDDYGDDDDDAGDGEEGEMEEI